MLDLKVTDGVLGVRPDVAKPHPGFYHELGEERFKTLVYDHYELLKTSEIAFLFPVDEDEFEEAMQHNYHFLTEISGGPDLFTQHRGAYQMVGRHAPFRIDEHSRVVWISYYIPLLEDLEEEGYTPEYIESFWNFINIYSMWLVNTKS